MVNWSDIKHFKSTEFDSPDAPGSGHLMMATKLILMLEDMREDFGHPLHINSGFRTSSHNVLVGGKPNSAHLTGHAVDIRATTGKEKFNIVKYALDHGVERIGIGSTFIHLDTAPNLPSPSIWLY